MSDAAAQAGAPTAGGAAPTNPWIIAVLVALATFMEVLDTTIANVVLPYIAGGMGVSYDEASWVVTSYLVSNAVSLTASPFYGQVAWPQDLLPDVPWAFHRKLDPVRTGLESQLSSLLSHPAGLGRGRHGAGLAVDSGRRSFPPQKRGQAFALFGVAVVVAPVVGPALGGWLADNYSWRWCFLINGPVGLATIALIADASACGQTQSGSKSRGSMSSAFCWWRLSSARSRSCLIAASRTTGSPQALS